MSTAKYCEPKSIKKYFDKFLKLVKVPKSEPKSIASKQTVNSIPFDLNSETKDMSHAMKLLISLWSIVFLLFFISYKQRRRCQKQTPKTRHMQHDIVESICRTPMPTPPEPAAEETRPEPQQNQNPGTPASTPPPPQTYNRPPCPFSFNLRALKRIPSVSSPNTPVPPPVIETRQKLKRKDRER